MCDGVRFIFSLLLNFNQETRLADLTMTVLSLSGLWVSEQLSTSASASAFLLTAHWVSLSHVSLLTDSLLLSCSALAVGGKA